MMDILSEATDSSVVKIQRADLRACPRSVWAEAYTATVSGREFALFKTADGYLVTDRRCPHKQADLARFGYLKQDEGTVLCTAHAHEYNLTSGRCLRADTCKLIAAFIARPNTTEGTIEIVLHSDQASI